MIIVRVSTEYLNTLGFNIGRIALALITCNTLKWTSPLIIPTMLQQTIVYMAMILPYLFTWTTHTEESTTLLEATRLQEALLYTALHYT